MTAYLSTFGRAVVIAEWQITLQAWARLWTMRIGPQYSKRKIKITPVWNMQKIQRLKYILYIYILYIIIEHTHLSNL